jgi:hypothetical protein
MCFFSFSIHIALAFTETPLAYEMAKALCVESEMQSGSGYVLSDLAFFFSQKICNCFPPFLTLKRLGR